jgi:hypothetical protein
MSDSLEADLMTTRFVDFQNGIDRLLQGHLPVSRSHRPRIRYW